MNKFFITLFFLLSMINCQNKSGYYVKGENLYYNGKFITNISYQKSADIMRLRHLEYYVKLIELYNEKSGQYPFQSNDQIYVFIANSDQIQFTENYKKNIPAPFKTISFKDFILELERVIEKPIDEYYDPQNAPDVKYNWYLYAMIQNDFYFAIHVHQDYIFSKKLGDYSYKIEVSNYPNYGKNLIISPERLLNSDEFINEKNKIPIKEDFFINLQNQYINETKESTDF